MSESVENHKDVKPTSTASQAAQAAKEIADKLQETRLDKLAEASGLNDLSAKFLRIGDVYGRIGNEAAEIPLVSMDSGLASLKSFRAFIDARASSEFTNPFIASLSASASTMASGAVTLYGTACPESPIDVTLFISDRMSVKKKFVESKLPSDISKTFSGAWESFDQGVSDPARAAAFLMRETVRHFVGHHAPDEEVKQATWFIPDASSKSGVTRKQRIKLMVEKNYLLTERPLKENLFNGFDDLYTDLSAAHERRELNKSTIENFLNTATGLFHEFLMDAQRRAGSLKIQ